MRAIEKYIPQIARQWYQLKQETAFAQLEIEWSVPLCATYLQEVLEKPGSYIAIEVTNGKVTAACGASLVHLLTPPHPLTVTEWLWTGTGKPAARVWKECREWGKAQGALLAHCAVGKQGKSKVKFTESYQWRVL